MLLWLRRTPESFVPELEAADSPEMQLPQVGPERTLRVDTKAVHAALEERRLERGITWKQVADEIGGIAPSGLTRLSKGGRTSFPDVMRIALWLERPVASLTRASQW
jgi:hypothetical protein